MADISLFRARLLTLACSWATLVAGVAEPQAIYVGVEGGSNVATFAGRDVGYASSRTGLAFGASARIPVTPALAFRPGILYSQQGAQWAVSGGVLGVRINYLEVPLLANVTLPVDENAVIPSFYAGPVLDLRLGCSVSAASGGLSSFAVSLTPAPGSVTAGAITLVSPAKGAMAVLADAPLTVITQSLAHAINAGSAVFSAAAQGARLVIGANAEDLPYTTSFAITPAGASTGSPAPSARVSVGAASGSTPTRGTLPAYPAAIPPMSPPPPTATSRASGRRACASS